MGTVSCWCRAGKWGQVDKWPLALIRYRCFIYLRQAIDVNIASPLSYVTAPTHSASTLHYPQPYDARVYLPKLSVSAESRDNHARDCLL